MAVANIVVSVAIAVIAAGGPELSPRPQVAAPSSEPIRVVSTSHEVRFPDEVVFKLDAEADFSITDVTLYYVLAGQSTQVYGYPEFTPATRVTTDFSLRTSGASYLPSGVDIEYYYKISDAEGNTLETERNSLAYRDPRYRWRELRYGDLEILWHDLPASRVERVAAEVDRRLERVKRVLELDEAPPMRAVLLNSFREARRGFPVISEAASRGHLYGGFAFGAYDLFVLAGLSADGMVHEATHLLLDRAVDSPLARVPAWLNEGLAMYFESDSYRREATVARAARDSALLRLGAMNTVPGRPEDVRQFYAQSWSVVDYMIETYGVQRISRLLAALDDGQRIDRAIADVYGISLDELDDAWRREVTGTTTLAPRPDPGTTATTFLIAGAIAVALSVSAYRWLLHRSRRSEPESLDL